MEIKADCILLENMVNEIMKYCSKTTALSESFFCCVSELETLVSEMDDINLMIENIKLQMTDIIMLLRLHHQFIDFVSIEYIQLERRINQQTKSLQL